MAELGHLSTAEYNLAQGVLLHEVRHNFDDISIRDAKYYGGGGSGRKKSK